MAKRSFRSISRAEWAAACDAAKEAGHEVLDEKEMAAIICCCHRDAAGDHLAQQEHLMEMMPHKRVLIPQDSVPYQQENSVYFSLSALKFVWKFLGIAGVLVFVLQDPPRDRRHQKERL